MSSSRAAALLAIALCALSLGGCKQKQTGPDVAASETAPVVAPAMPPVTAVPRSAHPMADFAALDRDHDGRIASAEHAQAAQALFEMVDMQHDGNLGLDELKAGAAALADIDGVTPERLLAIADADHDGKLTLSEWMAFANARFGLLDRNGDNFVDRAEWDAPHPPLPPVGG
ncbi:EF-hand domain-containing protein [Novosphingobium huizhouense]|uniref:EF-hand domain-containing protein n=1 Tax=Novosphingobium huizhouense TaxID=2866625 RepID=UPI001CD863B7|nr:hypothetical protein [Novosphingobium huizhouense]